MNNKFIKSATLMIIATILARLLGFVRELFLASFYGASVTTDAFIIAFTAPSILFSGIGASIAATFIPQYQKLKLDRDKFISNILNVALIVALIFSILLATFPGVIVRLFAAQASLEVYELAKAFLRLMVWTIIPVISAEIFRAYLQIYNSFFISTIAGASINLCVIIGILLSRSTNNLYLMSIGATVGNYSNLIVLFAFSRKNNFAYQPYLNLKDENLHAVFRGMLPVFVASMISELNQIIDKNFAASLSSGTISSLNYAAKVNALLVGLIGTVLATVLFPKMAEQGALNKIYSIKRYLKRVIVNFSFFIIPIGVGIFLLAEPITKLLFERGSFTSFDSFRTSECLKMYSIGFITMNYSPFLTRVYHSLGDTKTPAIASGIGVMTNILLNTLLVSSFKHMGLALSTSVSSIISVCIMLICFNKRYGSLKLKKSNYELLKCIFATAVMGVAIHIVKPHLPMTSGSQLQTIISLIAIVALAVTIYFAMLFILKSSVLREAIGSVKPKKTENFDYYDS